MISLKELNPHKYQTNREIDYNLNVLLERMNTVRAAYGKPMVVTSGLRSESQQQQLIKEGKSTATKSNHLMGKACDIKDSDGRLADWIKKHIDLMIQIGLWFEDFDYTEGWVHFQIVPPKSGKRFFIP